MREKMYTEAEKLKDERKQNSDLLPVDENSNNIDIVKEQILNLNDKFDYLMSLLVKNN